MLTLLTVTPATPSYNTNIYLQYDRYLHYITYTNIEIKKIIS